VASPSEPLSGKRLLLGLSGGIACTKTATLVSRLVQDGAQTRVLMTQAATQFVGPVTFRSLTGEPVVTDVFTDAPHPDSPHVGLARWADALVIAPATADLIARLAHGLCDDPISLVSCALPRETPVLLAPAMNAEMWSHPITQRNVQDLRATLGWEIAEPEEGWQACRTEGAGRMRDPEALRECVQAVLQDS
jgi:phosphopantothenoylcysteine decarboxylase/phosphopantothenate--cysteine ligase